MKKLLIIVALFCVPSFAIAGSSIVKSAVESHILPRFEALAQETGALSDIAQTHCNASSAELKAAYHSAFDAWASASHLRMGPSETNDRAFAIAFWPDPRGKTPKVLAQMIRDQDQSVQNSVDFAQVSIAARGLYALDFLLFDEQFTSTDASDYKCALVKAISYDLASNTGDILADWQRFYAEQLISPSENGPYRSDREAVQALFKALATGLQFTSDTRLGRPLGTIDKPRPLRAEARRSGRSARNVDAALASLADLAGILAMGSETQQVFRDGFERARGQLESLNDPVFAKVANPQGRFEVEIVQLEIDNLRDEPMGLLGDYLGVGNGFNALDGD